MDSSPVSPRLAFIQLHPIKALDSVHVKEARIGPGGGLELDRAWALYSADGQWVNGKRTPAVHLIRAAYAPDLTAVSLSVPGDRRGVPTSTFAFPGDTAGAAEWLDRKSTRLNSSHGYISYAVFCLKKKKHKQAR